MRAPGLSTARFAAALLLLLAACATGGLAAGCASGPSGGGGGGSSSPRASGGDAPSGETALEAGFYDPRSAARTGRLIALTLVNETTEKGRKMTSGLGTMDGGKVVDAATAAAIADSFREAGFDRFCLRALPTEGPSGALGVVWIDRGNGVESLFLMPGAVQNPETKDLPHVYQAIKLLIFKVHQATPGSMVTSGEGWSGDDIMNQKPERRR